MTDLDPHSQDDEPSPEDLGPRLQSELEALLAGLDDVEASDDESGEQPASPLPKQSGDAADDQAPWRPAKLYELLAEDSEPEASEDTPEASESSAAELPVDQAAKLSESELEAIKAVEELDLADIEAQAGGGGGLDALLAEDDAPRAETPGGQGDEADEIYDEGVTDAVSLDDYDAQRDLGELQDAGIQDESQGLAWDEEAELAEAQDAVNELQAELNAGEALLNEEPLEVHAPLHPEVDTDAVDDGALADLINDLESDSPEETQESDLDAAAVVGAVGAVEEDPFDILDESEDAQDRNNPFRDEAADAPAPNAESLDHELFEEAPQRSLEEALAAEVFDLDEDLFDFASLESGGGLAADDALDIEEFLEAVGEGESFGSPGSGSVEDLDAGDDLFAQAAEDSYADEQESEALDSIDAELEQAESQAAASAPIPAAPQPLAPQGQVVLAGGGRTWAWWLAGVAILVGTNLSVATFLSADRDIARNHLDQARASLIEATAELAEHRAADAAFLSDLRTPLALPEIDPTSAFAQVHEALDIEDFTLARRRLYALLATVDRRESPEERETIEVHAAFMLADIDRLEADAMGERP